MSEQELCMRHQGGYQKKVHCWFCKSKEEQAEIMERIFKTKQEEIREGIEEFLISEDGCHIARARYLASELLKLEDKLGVVIKVARELPNMQYIKGNQAFVDIVKGAGYAAFEPLI